MVEFEGTFPIRSGSSRLPLIPEAEIGTSLEVGPLLEGDNFVRNHPDSNLPRSCANSALVLEVRNVGEQIFTRAAFGGCHPSDEVRSRSEKNDDLTLALRAWSKASLHAPAARAAGAQGG